MPIHPLMEVLYPLDWAELFQRTRFQRTQSRCEWSDTSDGQPHPQADSKIILPTAHLGHNPDNNTGDNLVALCQKYHNTYDAGKRNANHKHRANGAAGQLPLFEPLSISEPPVSYRDREGDRKVALVAGNGAVRKEQLFWRPVLQSRKDAEQSWWTAVVCGSRPNGSQNNAFGENDICQG